MMMVKLLCIGKLKEPFYKQAVEEYIKRLNGLCRLEIEEFPENRLSQDPLDAEIEASLKKEAELIGTHIPPASEVIAMCIEGKQLDSVDFARYAEQCALNGKSRLCFLIGGSFGMHESLKQKADFKLSMSSMTFPHHLARVMLLEQIYRAFQIQNGSKYHK